MIAVMAIQCGLVAGALGSYGNRGGKREVKGGGGEPFELLLVIIDDLEEPSDLVWLRTLLYRSTYITYSVLRILVLWL